jgi:hypothetical protein
MKQAIDRALFSALTRRWEKKAVDHYSKSLQLRQKATPDHISEIFRNLDAKATALLTYVAMMIAGLGIVAPIVAQYRWEEAIVIAQIAVFLIIAIGCLRCLSVFSSLEYAEDAETVRKSSERELIIRQELFRICHRAAIIFTFGVVVSLPVLLVWRPAE